MADIVLGIASSHGPMLGSPVNDFLKHAERDLANKAHLDLDGVELTYDAMFEKTVPAIADELRADVISDKVAGCQAGIAHLVETLAEVDLDVIVIIGDGQHEQFLSDNQQAVLIYSGETIENGALPLPATAPKYWKTARSQ